MGASKNIMPRYSEKIKWRTTISFGHRIQKYKKLLEGESLQGVSEDELIVILNVIRCPINPRLVMLVTAITVMDLLVCLVLWI